MNTIQESILFKTSAASDVQCSNGILSVAGLSGTKKTRISSITQLKYHAEVVQVITVGATTYTPTGSTKYTVEIGDTTRRRNGAQEDLKRYTYTTPASITDLGATAALQREAISVALVASINADTSNFVTAATAGSGNGFTVTDAAGYYPVFSQTTRMRNGASTVRPCQNPDDSGYLSTNVTTTTAAVYSFGVGADLASSIPVIDALYGGLLSGYLLGLMNGLAPKTAAGLPGVSGQNYDAFIILSLTDAPAHNQRGQLALVPKMQAAFVDNGTGSSTSNLAGFVAFEREILRHVFATYQNDPSTIYDFFDNAPIASATYPTTGAAITTTDNVVMAIGSTNNLFTWYVNPIGTHTLLTPIVTTAGLQLLLDVVDEEGMELSAPILTQCPKEFIVGKAEYSFYARVTSANYLHLEEFAFGLRKKAAYAVNLVAYDVASADFAALGVVSEAVNGLIKVQTSKAAGGILAGTTAGTWTSGAHDMMITVDINGAVKFYLDSADVTATQTTAYTFTAGTHLIPFIDTTLDANADAAPIAIQTAAVPSIGWRV